MYEVEYAGGESRDNPGTAVDYMRVFIGDLELYAEVEAEPDDETGNYERLKETITTMAEQDGIDTSELKFWYDE